MNKFEEKSNGTKENLINAFWELMKERNIQKIRIKDITDRAGVYRSTFYLHFTDVYDLLEKEEDILVDKWKEKTEQIRSGGSPYDYIAGRLSEFYDEDGDKVLILLEDNADSHFEERMKRAVRDRLAELYGYTDSTEFEYAFEFYMSGIIGALTKWYREGKRERVGDIIGLLMRLISECAGC